MEKIDKHYSNLLKKDIIHYELYGDYGLEYSCIAYSEEEAREKKDRYLGVRK